MQARKHVRLLGTRPAAWLARIVTEMCKPRLHIHLVHGEPKNMPDTFKMLMALDAEPHLT